ncbi:MAG: hypothetical protein BZY87_10565 [SAR202 cluster bacterium Io17-Chloro-G6]|nr:MAG: hypothetical protein BZY87_10565 [SAR202 cluster bacterium Io17-Chloro-G6]
MASSPSKYYKELADFSIEYSPSKAYYVKHRPFTFQVSLGEMNLEDAFWVELGPEYVDSRLGDFLDDIFSGDRKQQSKFRSLIDVRENPDLPDMYNALLEIFSEWRSGKCALHFFANQGPEIKLTDRLDDHLSLIQSPVHGIDESPLLDLVIDQELDVLDYLANAGYFKAKKTTIEFMQANMLMYFLDKHQYKLSVKPIDETDQNLLPIAKKLQSAKLIAPSDLDGTFAITEQGRQAIGKTIAETDTYIDQYDVFKDVFYDADSGALEFETGLGRDLRVQLYEYDEQDPVRVVFLLRLYDSTFDAGLATWRESIHSEQFFGEVLSPIVDAEREDETMLESILDAGYAFAEEQSDATRAVESQEDLLRRIREE